MRYFKLMAVAIALFTLTASANAQQPQPAKKLDVGQWTGKVTPPDGQVVDVTFDVTYAGDTLQIKLNASQHGEFTTTEAKFDGTKISFKFRPGPEVVCVLEKKAAVYTGVCTEDSGETASIEMSPPKKEGK